MKRFVLCALLVAACSSPQQKPDDQRVEQASEPESGEPEAPVGEYEIATETVEIVGDVKLRGDLVRPVTDRATPAAIIVHDWGMLGRDGIVGAMFGVRLAGEVAVYRSLAEGLASRGIAVLIYDRRNCVQGTQPWCDYPTEYADDALPMAQLDDLRAVKAWLGEQDRISSVSLIGHGHGAEVATIAATDGKTARLALLHPTMTPLPELAKFQVEKSIEVIDERIETVGDTPEADLLRQQQQQLRDTLAADNLLNLGADGLAELERLHTMYNAALDELERDVLVIEATLDPGEPRSETDRRKERFEEALVAVDGLSRAMVAIGKGDDSSHASPEVVTRLSAFLAAAK